MLRDPARVWIDVVEQIPDKRALFDAVLDQVAREIVDRIDAAAVARRDPFAGLLAGCEEWSF